MEHRRGGDKLSAGSRHVRVEKSIFSINSYRQHGIKDRPSNNAFSAKIATDNLLVTVKSVI